MFRLRPTRCRAGCFPLAVPSSSYRSLAWLWWRPASCFKLYTIPLQSKFHRTLMSCCQRGAYFLLDLPQNRHGSLTKTTYCWLHISCPVKYPLHSNHMNPIIFHSKLPFVSIIFPSYSHHIPLKTSYSTQSHLNQDRCIFFCLKCHCHLPAPALSLAFQTLEKTPFPTKSWS